ncbi:Phage head-tail adaptor [Alteracholeplasma palmae J233]|uniref:Phage head-tail adaptor n=1 Tax=Alteracholeplasma palmae (strain ATCC 49389 / J233) TaxID=1318466 RepID=U4KQK2_ALTPJ|nr:hypothetical protein [Alteracholeplasma palmae]CCV64725.1 Phage head-tail adaptor [Alteracholeplasma palmae J233]
MNKEWSDTNKKIQILLNKKETFELAITTITELRNDLFNEIQLYRKKLSQEDYSLAPFIKSKGYENKTVAYSIYHIFRIEDIVCNILIGKKRDILNKNGYDKKLGITVIKTGNELSLSDVVDESKRMNIDELYNYISDVYKETDIFLKKLKYEDLKVRFDNQDIMRLNKENVVSEDESAAWLINYWCKKDIKGLLKMPFTRHWIMHIEASNRIIGKMKIK